MSDKKRDKTRTLLKNLKVVIVDEVSMVKSDLLYQLDLRLREISQKPTKLFGGVAILYMGDIMQLRPCKGSFIFAEPKCKDYLGAVHILHKQGKGGEGVGQMLTFADMGGREVKVVVTC